MPMGVVSMACVDSDPRKLYLWSDWEATGGPRGGITIYREGVF